MTIEDRIRISAHLVADEVDPPTLDIDLVRRGAHAGRRRRAGIVAAVAATVAVCLLVPRLLGSPSTAPDPVDRPPGPVVPSGSVWADADGLHLGNRVFDLAIDSQSSPCAGDPVCSPFTSLALVGRGVVYGDIESRRVWYQQPRGPARLIGEGSQLGPAGDPDGTTAAWFDGTELVMFDTATGRELSRTTQGVGPYPQRENAHGNLILDVSSEAVTWLGQWLYRFDRVSGNTSQMRGGLSGARGGVTVGDVHAGWVARQNDSGFTEVISRSGDTTLKLESDLLTRPLRFNADGRYLAGINERDGHGVNVADTRTGEVLVPWRKEFYPWIGWGSGDTLMVIQDIDNPDEGTDQLLACDVSERSCQRINYKGVITLPSG